MAQLGLAQKSQFWHATRLKDVTRCLVKPLQNLGLQREGQKTGFKVVNIYKALPNKSKKMKQVD